MIYYFDLLTTTIAFNQVSILHPFFFLFFYMTSSTYAPRKVLTLFTISLNNMNTQTAIRKVRYSVGADCRDDHI